MSRYLEGFKDAYEAHLSKVHFYRGEEARLYSEGYLAGLEALDLERATRKAA